MLGHPQNQGMEKTHFWPRKGSAGLFSHYTCTRFYHFDYCSFPAKGRVFERAVG